MVEIGVAGVPCSPYQEGQRQQTPLGAHQVHARGVQIEQGILRERRQEVGDVLDKQPVLPLEDQGHHLQPGNSFFAFPWGKGRERWWVLDLPKMRVAVLCLSWSCTSDVRRSGV